MSFKLFSKSVHYALRGLVHVWKSEQNFRVQTFLGIGVFVVMWMVPLETWQRIILCLLIAMVLILEIVNSVFERLIDVLKSRIHPSVRDMKDMMAAAVLMASVVAGIVGGLILYPTLSSLWMG